MKIFYAATIGLVLAFACSGCKQVQINMAKGSAIGELNIDQSSADQYSVSVPIQLAKEMSISSGQQMSPTSIDRLLATNPSSEKASKLNECKQGTMKCVVNIPEGQ